MDAAQESVDPANNIHGTCMAADRRRPTTLSSLVGIRDDTVTYGHDLRGALVGAGASSDFL